MSMATNERPAVETRPGGSSFLSLVQVELRRLWWRRITKVVLGVVLLGSLGFVYTAYEASSPEKITQALEQIEQMRRDIPLQQEQCLQEQQRARDNGDPNADFGCSSGFEVPTLDQMGVTNPVQAVITATLSKVATPLFGFLSILLGASLIAAEFANRTMGTWLTFTPRRMQVAESKLIAAVAGGALISLVGYGVISLGAWLVATINRPDASLNLPDAQMSPSDPVSAILLRCVGLVLLAALGGGALALLLRSTAAAFGAVVGFIVLVSVLVNLPGWTGRFRHLQPDLNLTAVMEKQARYGVEVCGISGSNAACDYREAVVTQGAGWTYFLVIVGVVLVLALVTFRRRDVD